MQMNILLWSPFKNLEVILPNLSKELESFREWHMDNMVSLSLAKTEGIYFCPKRKLKPHLNFKLIVMGM
jgi:hypothetical protein